MPPAEDLVEIVDRHAVCPVYAYPDQRDQSFVIERVHTLRNTSVVVTDEVKQDLSRLDGVTWYSLKCANYGMIHSYTTVIATERNSWVPYSGHTDDI